MRVAAAMQTPPTLTPHERAVWAWALLFFSVGRADVLYPVPVWVRRVLVPVVAGKCWWRCGGSPVRVLRTVWRVAGVEIV